MDCASGRSDTGRRLSCWTQVARRPQVPDSSRGAATQRVKERAVEQSLGGGGLHPPPPEPGHRLPERGGRPPGPGRLPVPVRTLARRLRLTAGQGDSGDGATLGDFKPTGGRHRATSSSAGTESGTSTPRPTTSSRPVTGPTAGTRGSRSSSRWGRRRSDRLSRASRRAGILENRGDARSPRRTPVHGGAWSVAPQGQVFMGLNRRTPSVISERCCEIVPAPRRDGTQRERANG